MAKKMLIVDDSKTIRQQAGNELVPVITLTAGGAKDQIELAKNSS